MFWQNIDPIAAIRLLGEAVFHVHAKAPNQMAVKDPSLLRGTARTFADLPGGHSDGYGDTFKQIFRRFYASIFDPDLTPEYPQMEDGLHQMKLLDAVLVSNEKRGWVVLSTG